MAEKILILTDAHRREIESRLRQLKSLKRELAALQEAGVMDCSDYSELCDFVAQSLEKKHNYFFPRGRMTAAAKGGE